MSESYCKCSRCGTVVRECELETHSQRIGYYGDQPISESLYDYECSCGGGFEYATQCGVCGEYFVDDFFCLSACEDCIDKELSNVGNLLEQGEESKTLVEINGFLASVFSEEQINEILLNVFEGADKIKQRELAREFYESDRTAFADFMCERKKRGD